MKGLITHTVIKGNSFIYGISNPANRSVISQNIPKCPKVSHCPTPCEPGQWDRTGQHNNQRKKKGGRQ